MAATPQSNKAPHYIVVKADLDDSGDISKVYDLSEYISAVRFNSTIGQFPRTKLDFIPDDNVLFGSNVYDGVISVGGISIDRNDHIVIAEVDEDEYKKFLGTGDKRGPMPDKAIVVMWGVLSDVMTSWSGTTAAISVVIDSELSYLDTTLTYETLGSRGSGLTVSTLLPPDTKYDSITKKSTTAYAEAQGILETIITRRFISRFPVDTNFEFDESHDMWAITDRGLNPLPVPKGKVVSCLGDSGRVQVNLWRLIRLVMCHCMAQCLPLTDEEAQDAGVIIDDLKSRVERIISLMFRIEAQDGEDQNSSITLSRNEYSSFLKTTVIKPMVSAPSQLTSLWSLITMTMGQLHFYFTPKVLYSSKRVGSVNLGSFKMMNPYREYTTEFSPDTIEAYQTSVPDYKSIIRSIGFKVGTSSPSFVKEVTTKIPNIMYSVYRASPDDFVLKDTKLLKGLGNVPTYAYHKEINFPEWLPEAIMDIHRLHSDETFKRGESEETAYSTLMRGKNEGEDLDSLAETLKAFLKSALMIYGRISVTGNLSLIRLWSDCLDPLRVILVNSGKQVTTGLISSVNVEWVQGQSYKVTAGLSNITDIRDPYFRALENDLVVTDRDNLIKYIMKPYLNLLDYNPPSIFSSIA